MRDRWVLCGVVTLAVAAWPTCAPAMPTRPPGPLAIAVARDSSDGGELRLRRAAAEQRLGNLRGVVEMLEPIDFAQEPSFAGADRAAFLLGHAYLELGSRDRFERLARQVAGWNHPGLWTQWLANQLRIVQADTDAGAALARLSAPGMGVSPALSRLIGTRPSPADTAFLEPDLDAASTLDTITTLGRDLAGAALVRRATRALERGEDARPLLEQVPVKSRYAARARHMLGLIQLEHGDVEAGRATLSALAADSTSYAFQREVLTALASQAMDASDWASARSYYERVDRDWRDESDTLRYRIEALDYAPLWAEWESGMGPSNAVVLDAAPTRKWTERLALSAANLSSPPGPMATPHLDAPQPGISPRWLVPPPPPGDWVALGASQRRLDEARDALGRADAAVADVRRLIAERVRYYEGGYNQAHATVVRMGGLITYLDSLRMVLGDMDSRLKAVRDEATRHILARTASIVARAEDQARWMLAMRHFNIDGPTPRRPLDVPPGYPSPDSLLTAEESLTRTVTAAVESLAARAPGLIQRSYQRAWRPGIIDRAEADRGEALGVLAWAKRVSATIDSSLLAVTKPDSLHRLEARAAVLARNADSLNLAHQALRARVTHAAAERALAALDQEREGIDYGLAASAYGLSVGFERADTTVADANPADTTVIASEDPDAKQWRTTAIEAMDAFLKAHPQSLARGEMRFRLADLVLVDARQAFREKMARFVREQATTGRADAVVPTIDASRALEIYRTMLREDQHFAHLDAVLFDAGMILADAADPDATPIFQRLVTAYPTSPYCQQVYVRMGDVGFTDHRYAECIPYYEHAAEGADTTLRAIALYKLGWSRFSLDQFIEAADAFRQILDLYAAGGRVDRRVNLADEAEAYLVHTLARAGGADAFEKYFDKIGPRPYETRLLRAMGQHFRRYSLFAEAAEADRLLIRRHPLESDALVSVQRMVETYQRWDRPSQAQEARLEFAPQFAPGGKWYEAQASDSARTAGAEFAKAAWTTAAREHHRDARKTGNRAEYQEALRLYETVLSKWPDDPQAAALQLQAGEASAQLGDYGRSLQHYDAAAKHGPDSLATLALWQRVAVTDAWYQSAAAKSAQGAPAPAADSLARQVIATADDMLRRFPNHPQAADLMWRQGNLAFAHGWYERAASDFGRLAEAQPNDRRAPLAASLRADALFRLGHFGDAGAAYEQALATAKRAGADSLAKRAAQAIPVSYYRDAEAAVAADSTAYAKHAALFEKVASGWPSYEHADLARYRAGLASLKAGSPNEAIRLMRGLITDFPRSEFVRDAHLEIATISESQGQNERAGRAYAEFAARFPKDTQAGSATLKAADLFAKAGQLGHADTLRLDYMYRHPEDIPTAMLLLEDMSRRELANVTAERPISTLLPAPAPAVKTVKGRRATAPPRRAPTVPNSRLADYMARADAFPKLASHVLIAQVRFLQGEEANAVYRATTLRQPLNKSIPVKQKLLDATLAPYKQGIDLGDSEWAHASTYRIGQALVAFGDALEQSERPADLKGEDMAAYNDVLAKQARVFYDRGEDVWAELLRQKQATAPDEPWIRQAQASLWQRLGGRFRFRTEAEVPLMQATPPEPDPTDTTDVRRTKASATRVRNQQDTDVRAEQEKAQ